MRLPELFTGIPPSQDFQPYIKTDVRPPLQLEKLSLTAHAADRSLLRTPVEGDVSLMLRYKEKEGAVVSVREDSEREAWQILQVQGAKSPVSYRVATGVHWQELMAHRIKNYSQHPEADVRHIVMPPPQHVTNIVDAKNLENAFASYAKVRAALGMRFSEIDGLYIADVRQHLQDAIITSVSLHATPSPFDTHPPPATPSVHPIVFP